MGIREGAVTYDFFSDDNGIQAVLMRMDTALNPVSIAEFLGATVEPWFHTRTQDRFLSEGDDVTGKWVPLSAATREIRTSQGFGAEGPINVRTTQLENYIVNSPGLLESAGSASLTLPGTPATDVLQKKLTTAQEGDRRTPARPVLGMNEKDLVFVLYALGGFVTKKIAGSL